MIKTVAIIGSGQMGQGIAHVCALANISTYIYDVRSNVLQSAKDKILINLNRQVKKEVISAAQADKAITKISTKTKLGKWIGSVDVAIEAVSEDFDIKKKLYLKLTDYLSEKSIFATNTSAYSINNLASYVPTPENFIGMHFMNPVPMTHLVEIISGEQTSKNCIQTIEKLTGQIQKEFIHAQDHSGFITNRILIPFINESIFTLADKVGTIEDIDKAMRLGMNHPIGPLALADLIGLDTCLSILKTLSMGLKPSIKFEPCPLLKKMVENGYYGRKNKLGFYNYHQSPPIPTDLNPLFMA